MNENDKNKCIHLQINGNPIVPKDRLLCTRWVSINTNTTTDIKKVTCKDCLKKLIKINPYTSINQDMLNEIAKEWAADYKPIETDLPIQLYAAHGFIQGYIRAIKEIHKN